MNAPNTTLKAFTEAAADAVGREIAGLRREAQRERELHDAEYRARLAELDSRLASAADLERRLSDRLSALKDGEPGQDGNDGEDGEPGQPGNDGADGNDGEPGSLGEPGAPGRDGNDGKDGDPGEPGKDGTDGEHGPAGEPGFPGQDGSDGQSVDDINVEVVGGRTLELAFTVGETRSIFEIELPEGPPGDKGDPGERGEAGPVGMLPQAREWADRVYYEGEVAAHDGGTWQAQRDTGREPPSDDWICLAAPGTNGRDGIDITPRGLWEAEGAYQRNDLVALNGGSFIAIKDEPGPCPGEGWKLHTAPGKRGEKGERGTKGEKGERGLPGTPVVRLDLDDQGMLTLANGDGSVVQCDFYPVLRKLG